MKRSSEPRAAHLFIHRAFVLSFFLVSLIAFLPRLCAGGNDAGTEASPSRPSWISAEEARFFEETGGLRPVAHYDKSTGTVTIKLRKKGLSGDQIFEAAIGPHYDYYKKTDLVETSFRGRFEGNDYLFTGTVARYYPPIGGPWTLAFVPVVTRLKARRETSYINLSWERVDDKAAKAFIEAHKEKLMESMKGAGVEKSLEDYKGSIFENLSKTSLIWGQHEYHYESGYYIYQQRVKMAGKVSDAVARYAGVDDIKGAALKIAYQVLREEALAGSPKKEGKKVIDFSGAEIRAGR